MHIFIFITLFFKIGQKYYFLSNNAHHLYSLVVFKVIQLREKVHVKFGQQKLIVVVGYKLLLQLLYLS